jgi:FkbM family methyltransferase
MPERPIAYLGDHVILTKTYQGHKIYVDGRDTSVAPHILMDGFWESWITEFWMRLLAQRSDEPGAIVIDVGANVGYYSLLARWHPDPDQYDVWAYEPNPMIAELLRLTFSVNGMKVAQARQAAASDQTGTARMTYYRHEPAHAALLEKGHVERVVVGAHTPVEAHVETVTLDSEINPGSRVAAIKIDVEGHEPQVLAGAQRILDENPTIDLLVEHHNTERNYFAIEQLAKQGFNVFLVDHDAQAKPVTRETLSKIPGGEMLYCRRMDSR